MCKECDVGSWVPSVLLKVVILIKVIYTNLYAKISVVSVVPIRAETSTTQVQ